MHFLCLMPQTPKITPICGDKLLKGFIETITITANTKELSEKFRQKTPKPRSLLASQEDNKTYGI